MVYGRKRRSTYRRKGRRGNRTLSTRNIFNNKGSRAQASQISALRKRINYVYRQCKPEVKVFTSTPATFTLRQIPVQNQPYFMYKIEFPELGVTDNSRIGNVCNILDSHIFMNMRMAWDGDVNYQFNGLAQTVNTTIRVVPFMVKAATDYEPDPFELLPLSSNADDASQYRLNPIAPFNEGVSAKYHILGDYRYTMRMDDKALINSHIRIKGSRIKKYVDTLYNSIGKAQLYVLFTWNGLDRIIYQNETLATPIVAITACDKTAYTDP